MMHLNLCLNCKTCEKNRQDRFLIGGLTSNIEDCRTPYNLFSYFAEMRRDFFIARWLLSKFDYPLDEEFKLLNSMYEEIDLLDYASDDLRYDLLKICIQKSVGIFDKIAFFINEYEQLHLPHKQVWFSTRGGKRDIFKHLEGKYATLDSPENSNLKALRSISSDLKHPYYETCKTFRDSITHKYLKTHVSFVPMDSIRYPGSSEPIVKSLDAPHHDEENPKNYHISESTLKRSFSPNTYLRGRPYFTCQGM